MAAMTAAMTVVKKEAKMKKVKAKQIKKYSALGITFAFIGALITLAIIESLRKTPETANEELEMDFFAL